MFKRASGVLMHISSLPGRFGIGTLGKDAFKFVDFLAASGQSYWQTLPLCPISEKGCNSPYQSSSAYAGNELFIDLELLCEWGFLSSQDYEGIDYSDESKVDYTSLYKTRQRIFIKLFKNFCSAIPEDFYKFCNKNSAWLEDYALFMAIKEQSSNKDFHLWSNGIRHREQNCLNRWKKGCEKTVLYHKMLQYFFFKQWYRLKSYANQKGIKIIGDVPIYVSLDSADVWANPKLFLLNSELKPTVVSGCPPDSFSKNGQLWGNPTYDWDELKKQGYNWWIERIKFSLKLCDVVRIDHFRAFDSYYCIPYTAKNAKAGCWQKGPGMDFINALKEELPDAAIIAEDLGFLTESVKELLSTSGFYGMKVLQFAFDSRESNDYLPYKYKENSVVYTGTHDNDTILGWEKYAKREDVAYAKKYLRTENLGEGMMAAALASPCNLCILTMQDILSLGASARMNIPGTKDGNWEWRCTEKQLLGVSSFLLDNTKLYGRIKKGKNLYEAT